jgi:hypothetical protein
MSKFSIDKRQVDKLFGQLKDLPSTVMEEGGEYFKSITPYGEGNAQNRTRTNAKAKNPVIRAGYGYADRLDNGWSSQAPKGMSKPTEDKLDQLVDQYISRIK